MPPETRMAIRAGNAAGLFPRLGVTPTAVAGPSTRDRVANGARRAAARAVFQLAQPHLVPSPDGTVQLLEDKLIQVLEGHAQRGERVGVNRHRGYVPLAFLTGQGRLRKYRLSARRLAPPAPRGRPGTPGPLHSRSVSSACTPPPLPCALAIRPAIPVGEARARAQSRRRALADDSTWAFRSEPLSGTRQQ